MSFEHAPIGNQDRTQFLPDSDRWSPAVGFSYKWSERLTVDFAYSHIFFKDAKLVELFQGNTLLAADAKTDVDFVSLGFKYKWTGWTPLELFK